MSSKAFRNFRARHAGGDTARPSVTAFASNKTEKSIAPRSSRMWKTFLSSAAVIAMLVIIQPARAITFENPIRSESLEGLILAISRGVLQLMLILAPLAILITGFRFLIAASSGDQGGLSRARQLFFWTLIGTALIVGASVIATAVINFARGL